MVGTSQPGWISSLPTRPPQDPVGGPPCPPPLPSAPLFAYGPELGRDRLLRKKRTVKHFLKHNVYYPVRKLLYLLLFRPFILPRLTKYCYYVQLVGGKVTSDYIKVSALPTKPAGSQRLVCLSDTHECLQHLNPPPGDLLLHAGDMAFKGGSGRRGYESINRYLQTLPHTYKVVIVGNHDWHAADSFSKKGMSEVLSNAIYLENDLVTLPSGLRVFGTPVTPLGSSQNTAFQYNLDKDNPFDAIPPGLDILISHATPSGHVEGFGDDLLKQATERCRPRVHICGHDHLAYGVSYNEESGTLVINASIVDETLYWPFKPPIVYDLLPSHV